jgi:hypothetical protein
MASRSDEGRMRAEALFKKREAQTKENEKVWAEHAAASRAADANRARLKSLRLAKEAADKKPTHGVSKPQKKSSK